MPFDAEAYLNSLEPLGWRFGLERMHRLTSVLGMPQHRFASIHVVGTNGKSSVAQMVAALLEVHGVGAGACLSPHLVRWSERVRIHGHEIDRTVSPPTFGEFISDPRCYYDASSGHFFMTILEFGRNPSTGAFEAPGTFPIATSKTGTPSTNPSDWNFFSVDVTNDGRNGEESHPNCPCFGDRPTLGIDANGIYVTTNEYPIDPNTSGFNGAQVYAIQKSALISGNTPNVVRFEGPVGPTASNDYGNNGLRVMYTSDGGLHWGNTEIIPEIRWQGANVPNCEGICAVSQSETTLSSTALSPMASKSFPDRSFRNPSRNRAGEWDGSSSTARS